MKIKLLIFLTLILVAGTVSFAQDTQREFKPFPFARLNDPKLSLISQVTNPAGYVRYPTDRLTKYQLWLSNLPLLPSGSPVLNWKGKTISKPDTLNRILDMNIDPRYITDADIPVLLLMHFFHLQGKLEKFNIILRKNLVVNYKDWLRGKYVDEKDREIYFKNEGLSRVDSDEEFQKYMEFVTKNFDTKSLRMNVEHTDSRVFEPSHMFIQFKEDDPDSIGHTSVILDIAVAEYKPRKMLVAYGGNPAQSVVLPNAGMTTEARWLTLDELREHLKEYGMGYIYRWKE